ncbi:MAG: hypothetical protein IKM59_00325 [Oscillospiraceae bacterium]|nr:hypothetical protein [Oscillospiraceae bacterium]
MKKWIAILLIIAMLLTLVACKDRDDEMTPTTQTTEEAPAQTASSKEESTETSNTPAETNQTPIEITEEPTATTEATTETATQTATEPTETEIAVEEEFWQEENLVYPLVFHFSSGAGAWYTSLYLYEDGSFTGEFHDANQGENGDAYPYGTINTCTFTGKFASAERLDMYTYGMKLEYMETDSPVGEEWIEEGVRYVTAMPYGLEEGENFQIFLPNTPASMLSEDQLFWWPGRFREGETILRAYGLLNMNTDQCFFTETIQEVSFPLSFYFSSGAGGWGTELYLEEDGSFTGYYRDSEMGTTGEGYPCGTAYVCTFSGRFGQGKRIDNFTYGLKLEELNFEKPVGEEWIEDEIRYVASQPAGLELGTDYVIYLPNTPTSLLSEDQLFWWPGRYYGDYITTLHGYGLYNTADDSGFFCMMEE